MSSSRQLQQVGSSNGRRVVHPPGGVSSFSLADMNDGPQQPRRDNRAANQSVLNDWQEHSDGSDWRQGLPVPAGGWGECEATAGPIAATSMQPAKRTPSAGRRPVVAAAAAAAAAAASAADKSPAAALQQQSRQPGHQISLDKQHQSGRASQTPSAAAIKPSLAGKGNGGANGIAPQGRNQFTSQQQSNQYSDRHQNRNQNRSDDPRWNDDLSYASSNLSSRPAQPAAKGGIPAAWGSAGAARPRSDCGGQATEGAQAGRKQQGGKSSIKSAGRQPQPNGLLDSGPPLQAGVASAQFRVQKGSFCGKMVVQPPGGHTHFNLFSGQ